MSWFLAEVFLQDASGGMRGVVSLRRPRSLRRVGGSLLFPGHVGIIYLAAKRRVHFRLKPARRIR